MPKKAKPPQERTGIQLSPLLLISILFALVCTIAVAATWYLSLTAAPPGPPFPNDPPGGPPRDPEAPRKHATLVVVVGIAAVAWTSVVIVACRDKIIRHLDQVSHRLTTAGREFILGAEQLGVFRGMRIEEESRRPESERPGRPHGNGPDGAGGERGPATGGPGAGPGHVVRFPLSPRDDD